MIFRYFNVAGCDPEGEVGEQHIPETHLIPLMLDAIDGKRPALTVFGTDYPTRDGTCVRDYVHVMDLVEAHVAGLEWLRDGKGNPLDGPRDVGSGLQREEETPLSRLIDSLNDRFGTDFTDADQLFFDQIIEAAICDASLGEAAAANPEEKFALLFSSLLQTLFIERMEQNEDIFARFMNEKSFQNLVTDWISKEVYNRFARKSAPGEPGSLPVQ